MRDLTFSRSVRMSSLMLLSSFLFAACGGGSGTVETAPPPVATGNTGTIGILLTDAATDELSAINLDVTEATLISESGQQTVFSGSKTVNLLDLANFDQPIVFGEVEAATFTKLRLRIENMELVDNSGVSHFPNLPANGKIDLLDPLGFTIFPGRTLLAEVDIDANKSIHIVSTGSGTYRVRPVVKVHFMDGGLPDKLARLEGSVAEKFDDPAGSFRLCHTDNPDSCVVVTPADDVCIFGPDGLPTEIDTLAAGDPVVVIGAFRHEDDGNGDGDMDGNANADVILEALVIEIGGNATQTNGVVLSEPDENGEFELGIGDDEVVTVVIQDCTKVFGKDGPLGIDAIIVDATLLIDGVVVESDDPDTNDSINAALIFVDLDVEEESLSGTIVEPLDPDTRSFNLATDTGDLCVEVLENAQITLVSQGDDGTVNMDGEFSDLELGQSVEVFGHSGEGGCFQTSEVVVDLTE